MASTWPWSSGVSARSPTYASASERSSSGLCTGVLVGSALRALQLLLDLPAQVSELAEDVQRAVGVVRLGQLLQLRPRRLEAREELLCPRERFVSAHAAFSRTIL